MVDPNPIFSVVLWLIEIATAAIILMSEWEKRNQTKRQHANADQPPPAAHEDHDVHEDVPKGEQGTQ